MCTRFCLCFLFGILQLHGAEIVLQAGTAQAGTTVPLELRLNPSGSRVAALQFDVDHDPRISVSAVAGPSALNASKTLYAATLSSGRTRFLAAGTNRNLLGSGAVAILNAAVSSSMAPGDYQIRVTNAAASNDAGTAVNLNSAGGWLAVNSAAEEMPSTVFSQLATGNGWNTYYYLLNTTGTAQTATLTFWESSGVPFALPLVYSPESGKSPSLSAGTEVTVPAYGFVAVSSNFPQNAPLRVGWTRMRAPEGIVATATYSHFFPGRAMAEGAVPMESRTPGRFVMSYDNAGGFVTGVALVNDSDTKGATIEVTIRNASGQVLFTNNIILPIRGHLAFAVPDQYPNLSGIRGSMEFREVSGGKIAVLGLRFNPTGQFTSIPVGTR